VFDSIRKILFFYRIINFSNGNSLYIIQMKQRAAEEEVLLRLGIRFKIIQIQQEEGTHRNLFYIHILPSYMSHLN